MVWTSDILRITTDTTLSTIQDVYIVDASGGDITITLPDITSDGMQYKIKRIDEVRTNTVTIQGNVGQTINGQSTYNLKVRYAVELQSFDSNWITILDDSLPGAQIIRLSYGGANSLKDKFIGQGNTGNSVKDASFISGITGTIIKIYATKSGSGAGNMLLIINEVETPPAFTINLPDVPTPPEEFQNVQFDTNIDINEFDRIVIKVQGNWNYACAVLIVN